MPHCAEAVICETYLACWYTERDGRRSEPRIVRARSAHEVGINDNREFARHFFRKSLSRNAENVIDGKQVTQLRVNSINKIYIAPNKTR